LTTHSGTRRRSGTSVCLFEWNDGGHFPVWARAAAEALTPVARVVLAASDPLIDQLSDLDLETYSLGSPRPSVGRGDLGPDQTPQRLAERELHLLRDACETIKPDHCFHLFTDPLLRWWLREDQMPAPMTITIFHPMAHYPAVYGAPLSPRQRLQAAYLEHKLRRWRARPDAHAVFGHDSAAVARWAGGRGATARWLPDPVVPPPREPRPGRREGCVLYGAIDRRKGFDLLVDAIALAPTDLRLTVAGHLAPSIQDEFDHDVTRMRAVGADVEVDLSGAEAPGPADVLIRGRCAVLPYRPHLGISRVMMEAASVGTPVVGPTWGPNGQLIREYGLGLAVDPKDPVALREAILELSEDPQAGSAYEPGLARYVEERGGAHFQEEVRSAFGLTGSRPSGQRTRVLE